MEDPPPENIDGLKEWRHSFEHRINWSHIALAFAVVYLAAKLFESSSERSESSSSGESDESDGDGFDATEIEIGGEGYSF